MRIEPATLSDLPAIRAVYADAREIQREQGAILFYERQGFHFVGLRRIGAEPRLPPHYQGIELALLEAPCERDTR